MFFPEITGNECMKFLQNMVFTTDLFFDNGLSRKSNDSDKDTDNKQ